MITNQNYYISVRITSYMHKSVASLATEPFEPRSVAMITILCMLSLEWKFRFIYRFNNKKIDANKYEN